jgi:hypothetical protein
MVGRVPLIPLFLAGNSTPTIPHMFNKRKDSGFPYGCADTAPTDGLRGSNVYHDEVNPWLWQFGFGKPRLGGLTIKETSERKAVSNAAQACSSDSTSQQGGSSLIVCTSMYAYIPVCTSIYEYIRVRIIIVRGCKYS